MQPTDIIKSQRKALHSKDNLLSKRQRSISHKHVFFFKQMIFFTKV